MHARHKSGAVHTPKKRGQISSARALAIQSAIPRDKADVITGYSNDWKDVEARVLDATITTLIAKVRIYGNAVITQGLDEIVAQPDKFSVSAHDKYIKCAKIERPELLTSAWLRLTFDQVDFSEEDLRTILQQAAKQVPRTPDEPPLTVISVDGSMFVTFAH